MTVGGSEIRYGTFLNDLIAFLLVAVAIYFFVIKPVNLLTARMSDDPAAAPQTKTCPECLSGVPAKSRRCMYCTEVQETVP